MSSEPDEPPPGHRPGVEHAGESLRLRRARRLVLVGLALGALGALVTGVAGAPGRLGAIMMVLGTAFGAALAAVYLLVTALVDEFRQQPVPRSRPLWGLAAFVAAALLLVALTGLEP